MSEAMSKREIEDVLSSIRRLVSQDVNRPAVADTIAVAPADKLVLTPSLRVEPASDTPFDDPQPKVAQGMAISDADAFQPQSPELYQNDRAQLGDTARSSSLLSRISSAGDVVSRDISADIDKLESCEMADETMDEKPATASEIEENLTTAHMPDRERAEVEAFLPEQTDIPNPAIEGVTIEATLARLEELLSNPARAQSISGTQPSRGESDDEVIDEGMLYQLVAHIVRQELQGELGERITRNIRKLVRAEVARELQLRQL